MADTEKITVNMNVVDLGQVDLLVEQGFYSNRTDFIKTAIRNQISKHEVELRDTIVRKTFIMGVSHYDRKSLENDLHEKNMLEVKVVGMLILDHDITPELALKTIKSVKVYGTLRASEEVREALKDRII